MSESGKRSGSVDRVDVERATQAKREESGERRSAESERRKDIEERKRRAIDDQAQLLESLRQNQRRLEEEKLLLKEELQARAGQLAEAAEREVSLDDKIKRGSLVNTVVTTLIAALTALGSVGWWGYSRIQAQAQADAVEEERRRRVSSQLESSENSIKDLKQDLVEHKKEQAKVNADQAKVNTLQLIRGQRIETLLEMSLRRQGKSPPGKSPEQVEAECAIGIVSDPDLCSL